MSEITQEELPFRKWLIDRGASQLFDYPIADVESLFDTFDRTQTSPGPSVFWIETIANANYNLIHHKLAWAIRHAIHMWKLNMEEQEGRNKAVQLLFNLEQLWHPILYISEGTEEMEAPIFEGERYWPELRQALGYPDWDEERLSIWKRNWNDHHSPHFTGQGEACKACLWRINAMSSCN